MPLTMKPGKDCMQKCMHELKHKGTKERSHEQMVAICLKQCGQSKKQDNKDTWYMCDKCHEKFIKEENDPGKCPKCGSKKIHKLGIPAKGHDMTEDAKLKPGYIKCPYCNQQFSNIHWLKDHIIEKHPSKAKEQGFNDFCYEKDMIVNIDTQKRTKYYCRLCGQKHYSDTQVGELHLRMLKEGYKKESPKKRYKQYLIEKKGEERNINEAVGGRLY